MFPNGNVGLENSKFYEDVPARGHFAPAGTICVVKAEEMTLRLGDTVKFLDFTGLAQVVAKHKRAARLVAALKARSDLGSIKRSMFPGGRRTGVKLEKVGRKLVPKAGDEIGCLELLDHRRYTTALKAGPKPAFVATSRRPISRLD